jgi:hypothetical protein
VTDRLGFICFFLENKEKYRQKLKKKNMKEGKERNIKKERKKEKLKGMGSRKTGI